MDGGQLLLGQQAGPHIGDAHPLGDAPGHVLVVPGEHDQVTDAQLPQAAQHLLDPRPGHVGQGQQPQDDPIPAHDHDRLARAGQGLHLGQELLGQLVLRGLAEELRRADPDGIVPQGAPDALAGHVLHLGGLGQAELLGLGRLHHRLGQGMAGVLLHRGGHPQQLLRAGLPPGDHVRDLELAGGDGAGLVEGHGPDDAQVLQVHAAFDEHTVASGLGDPRQDAGRGADGQGAGGSGHQEQHAPVEALGQGHPAQEGRQQDHQHVRHQHGRHKPGGEALGELLGGALLALGLGHHLHDAAQGAVPGQPGHLHLQAACLVHRPREDRIPGALVHGHALPGDRALVDGALALEDLPVHGDAIPRADHYHIPHLQGLHRHFHDLIPSLQPGRLGHELAQGVDGPPGPVQGVVLPGMAQGEEEEQEGPFRPLAQDGRAGRGGQHEHVRVELGPEEAGDGVGGDVVAPGHVGQQVEDQGRLARQAQEPFADPADEEEEAGQPHQEQGPAFLDPVGEEGGCAAVIVLLLRHAHGLRRHHRGPQAVHDLLDAGPVQLGAVVGHEGQPRGVVHLRVEHAGQLPQGIGQGLGRVRRVQPGEGDGLVAVAGGDLRAGLSSQAFHPAQGQQVGVNVEAELRPPVLPDDVGFLDALGTLEVLGQARDALVPVGHLGEEQ